MKRILVCIGAVKCATTWVHDNLRHHPKVNANPIKEIHYFDQVDATDPTPFPWRILQVRSIYENLRADPPQASQNRFRLDWLARYLAPVPMDAAWYLSLFDHVPDDSLALDFSPGYALMSREGFEHLRSVLPHARILFQMRNPIKRCWSQFEKDVLSSTGKPFSPEQIIRILNKPQYVNSFYKIALDNLASTFNAADVMCVFYEDIFEDPRTFLRALCNFAEIEFKETYFPEVDSRINSAPKRAEIPPEVHEHLLTKHRETCRLVAERMGRIPADWQEDFG